jgi:putative flippase GtrA
MRQLLLYGVNGVINTALSYGLFVVLANLIDYRAAVVISYGVGMYSSYLLNGAIVFGASGRLGRFIAVNLGLMGVNLALTWTLVEEFAWLKELAQLAAIAVVFLLGFALNKALVFGGRTSHG